MANRFLSNIKINDSYTLPSTDGTNGQIISTDGSGNLSFIDNTGDNARSIVFTVKNISGGNLTKGTVVHASPSATPPSGNVIEVIKADNDVSGSMPAIGVLNETLANNAEGDCVMMGSVSGIDTSAFSVGDELYVDSSPGAFTATKPTGTSNLIQKIAIVIKSHSTNGLIEVFGAGRSNDVPNLVDRTITFSANQRFTDNSLILLGSGDMFQIGHKATFSQIATYEGHLYIDNNATDQDIIFRSDDGSGGLATYLFLDGSNKRMQFNTDFITGDNNKIIFGNSGDLEIYHDGSNSYIREGGTGDLLVRGNNLKLQTYGGADYLTASNGAEVELYYNNSKKFETTNVGVTITGTANSNGLYLYEGDFTMHGGSSGQNDIRWINTYGNWRIEVGDGANNFKIHSESLAADYLTLEGGGQLNLGEYGSGSFTGTATYRLAVDSSGDVIEIPIGGGAVDGSGTANTVTMWSDTDTITDAPITISGNNATFAGNVIANAFITKATNTNYNLITRDSSGNALFVQNAQSGANQQIARFQYGSATVNAGTTVLQVSKDNSYFTNTNLGIGTTSPSNKLFVTANTAGDYAAFIENTNSTNGYGLVARTASTGTASYAFAARAASTDIFVVRADGNVGIGTSSPSTKLETAGIIKSSGNGASFMFEDRVNSGNNWEWFSAYNKAGLYKNHNTAETVMTIDSSGNVGIGTDAPDGIFKAVSGTSPNAAQILIGYNSTSENYFDANTQIFRNGSYAERMRIDSSGNVLVGITAVNSSNGISLRSDGIALAKGFQPNNGAGSAGGITPNIYSPASATLAISTNSSERMRIDSSGSVGIGTTSPDVKLEVVEASPTDGIIADFVNSTNAGGTTAAIKLSNADSEACDVVLGANRVGANFGSDFFISLSDSTDGTNQERFRITEAGNVGIGTTSPSEKLVVQDGKILAGHTNSKGYGFHDLSNYSYTANTGRLSLVSNGTEAVSIDSSQNVGIGTTSPVDRLTLYEGTNNNVGIYFQTATSGTGGGNGFRVGQNDSNAFCWNYEATPLTFATSGTERMRIDSSGRVGIGTTNPYGLVEIYGNGNSWSAGPAIRFWDSTNSKGWLVGNINNQTAGDFYIRTLPSISGNPGTSNLEFVIKHSSGNVGIGTLNPTSALTINKSSGAVGILLEGDGTDVGKFQVASAGVNHAIQFGTISNNEIQFHTANTEKMRLTSDGKLGIGITNPEEKLHVNGNLKIENGGLVVQNSTAHGYVAIPEGAYYHSVTGSETGAIKITLPVHGTADMLSFVVDIYDYSSNESITVYIRGYLYQQTGNNEWVNLSVQIIASDRTRNYAVRFGADGSNNCVWIGETNTVWTYPQIQVRDFTSGFNTNIDLFTDGWDVSIVTSFDTVDETIINTFPISKEVENSNIRIANSASSYLNGGNVGIGTSLPSRKLHIVNTNDTRGILIENTLSTSYAELHLKASREFRVGTGNSSSAIEARDRFYVYDATAGAHRFTIDSSGKVGIGTTSPTYKFEVSNGTQTGTFNPNSSGFMFLGSTSNHPLYFGVNDSTKMVIDSDGDVGIATTSPGTKLHISGNSALNDTSTQSLIRLERPFNNNVSFAQGADIAIGRGNTYPSTQMRFILDSGSNTTTNPQATIMTLDSSGRVGIGTTSPNEKLEVRDGDITTRDASNTNYAQLSRYTGLILKGNGAGSRGVKTPNTDALTLGTNNTERMRIDSSGNVGINDTSPDAKLHITSTSGDHLRIAYSDSYYWDIARESADGRLSFTDNANGEAVSILTSGNIGIGTSSPTDTLHVDMSKGSGDIFFQNDTTYQEIFYGTAQTNGNCAAIRWKNTGLSIHAYGQAYGSQLFIDADTSTVAIGTTSPSSGAKLDVDGNIAIGNGYQINLTHSLSSNNLWYGMRYDNDEVQIYTYNASNRSITFNTVSGGTTITSQLMKIEAGGNVGIGTSSPSAKLHVNGNVKTTGDIIMAKGTDPRIYAGSGVGLNIDGEALYLNRYTSSNIAMVTGGGNVGIGTTSPNCKLQVVDSINHVSGNITVSDAILDLFNDYESDVAEKGAILTFSDYYNDGSFRRTTRAAIKGGTDTAGNTAAGFLAFYTDSGAANSATERMRIDDAGNVGIGETSPDAKLHVASTTTPQFKVEYDSTRYVEIHHSAIFNVSGAGQNNDFYIGTRGNSGNNDIVFYTGGTTGTDVGTERMRIDSNGNTLIGSSGSGNIYVGGQTSGQYLRLHHNNSSTYIDANGAYVYFRATSGANTRFRFGMSSDAGTFIAAGDVVAYGSPSDKTLKENIKPIENALDKVNKLKGVEFDWKKQDITNLKEDIGFIAQDVQEVLPQLVRENENGKLSLRHQGIVPVLVEAIKELKQEIETLKKQINN